MRILSIKGRNLASIEGDFSIDYTAPPLRNAGIYAITGPTGSGKSTILDALCLALYGRTPRQKAARENTVKVRDGKDSTLSQSDSRLIMRKGCADAMAEVSFVAMDTHSYTVRWTVKRARNNPGGQMQDPVMELLERETGRPFAGKRTEILREIERLTGMTFDQFTRSVLLAQGDFTAFLKADQNEKAELLEKLTGTEIYTKISALVYQKAKEAAAKVKEVETQLGGITLLSVEETEGLNQKLEALKREQKIQDEQKATLLQAIEWHVMSTRLQQNLDDAHANMLTAEQYLKDSDERQHHLRLVDQAQEARSIYLAKINAVQILSDRNAELGNVQVSLLKLKEEIDSSGVKLKEAEEVYQKVVESYRNARPTLAKARELDTLITAKKTPLEQARTVLEAAQAKVSAQKQEMDTRGKLLKQITDTRDELQAWLKANEARRPVADNAPEISTRLKEAERDLRQFNYHTTIAANATTKLNGIAKEIESKEVGLLHLTDQLAPLEKASRENVVLLKEVDKGKIEMEITSSLKMQENLSAALTILEKLTESRETTLRLNSELDASEKKIMDAGIQLEEINRRLPIAEATKEQTEKLLNAAKQRITENIEQLRGTLKEGEPCPVCGSMHHPYITGEEDLHPDLSFLVNEAKECTDAWMKLLNDRTSITEALKHLEDERQRLSLEKGISESALETHRNKWFLLQKQFKEQLEKESIQLQHPGLLQPTDNIDWFREIFAENETGWREIDEEHLNAIREKITANRDKTEELYRRNTEIRALWKNQEDLTTKIALLKEEVVHAKNELLVLNHQRGLTQQELETAKATMLAHQTNMEIIEKELSPWFLKQGWFDAWKTGTEGFINDLLQFSGLWNTKTDEWQRTEQQLQNLSTELDGIKKSLADKELEAATKEKALGDLTVEFDRLMQERAGCFGGKEVNLVEKEFAEAESNAHHVQEEIKKLQEGLVRQFKSREGVMEQLAGDIKKMEIDLQHKTETLNNWLKGFHEKYFTDETGQDLKPTDEAMLKEWLEVPSDWIKRERAALKELENELMRAKATYDERNKQLNRHLTERTSPLSLEELQQEKETLEGVIGLTTSTMAEISATLKQDGRNRIQARYLLSEKEALDAVSSRWQQLDHVIGSADGRKFRQVAQKYTLEVLLGYANRHLADLSPRYSLELVPESLALQVVDHDMGDEIRSVHYLSGGESFLVSLALALALASLSSSRMRVESLFIDEGFGSLDPDTLNTAMDALEKLQNSGRKVGVISHVQEMTERISVQIKIVKSSGGKSKVVVTG